MPNEHAAYVAGLSTLEVPNPLIRLPGVVPRQQTLVPVVVFAAAIEPGDPPDVAVGLALAAHMSRADPQGVSPPRVKTVRKRVHMPGKNNDRPKSEPTPARAALLANLSPDQIINHLAAF